MKPRIYYTKPSITEREIQYATDAARNGWGDRCYEYITRFENAFKEHLGVKYAIATSSCTGALHMGLAALGIGPGDEVILADTNGIATAAPIVHLGAKPVFVDILPDSWCIDPDLAEAAITPRTKAIIAVRLYGNLCEIDQLLAIGEKHRIPVIEDAAEAIGSIYNDFLKPIGISQYRLAKEIGVTQRRIGLICAGQRAITPDTALRLAAFFGTDAQSWVNLQAHYDTELAREAMTETLMRIHRYEPTHA